MVFSRGKFSGALHAVFIYTQNYMIHIYGVRYLPKGIFPRATSHRLFPKWQLPKCAISQAATSQRLG